MTEPYTVRLMDAIDFLKTIPDLSVDLIYTDPHYQSKEKWRTGSGARLKGAKFTVFPNDRFPELIAECQRVLKKPGHLYIHSDEETRDILKPIIEAAGLKYHKVLVWNRMAIGMGYHWRATYEFILFAEKGKKLLNNLGLGDIFAFKRLKGPKFYPTQKPLELAEMIIENSSNKGDVVCDPFMGSGTTGVAAIRGGRTFLGCDLATKAVNRTTKRLTKEVARQAAVETPAEQKSVLETAALDPDSLDVEESRSIVHPAQRSTE